MLIGDYLIVIAIAPWFHFWLISIGMWYTQFRSVLIMKGFTDSLHLNQ